MNTAMAPIQLCYRTNDSSDGKKKFWKIVEGYNGIPRKNTQSLNGKKAFLMNFTWIHLVIEFERNDALRYFII